LELTRYWQQKLDDDAKKLLYEIEVPTSLVLAEMEAQGVVLDVDYMSVLAEELDVNIKEIEAKIFAIAGEEFNLNSPKQLATILFEKLGLAPKAKKRGVQKFSTDAKVLEDLAIDNEIAKTFANIQEGDFVMAPDGEKVQVAAVREWDPEDVYEITLDDGSSYRCGINHIHNVSYRKDKNSEPIWENVDTKFILNHPDYNFQFRVAD
jgi:hypothetical protein